MKLEDRNITIRLIDTLVFSHPIRTEEEILDEVTTAVCWTKDGAHAIFVCVRVGRFGKTERNGLKQCEALGDFWKNAVVVFTHASSTKGKTDEEQTKIVDDLLTKAPEELKWLMRKVNGRRIVVESFNDMGTEYHAMKMDEVIRKIDETYDNAGRNLYSNKLLVTARGKFVEARHHHEAEIQSLQSEKTTMIQKYYLEKKAMEETVAAMKKEVEETMKTQESKWCSIS